MTDPDPRLPQHVVPSHYELELAPDLGTAGFTGTVAIDAELLERSTEIVCNAADLEIEGVSIERGGQRTVPDLRLDADTERLHLLVDEPLDAGPLHIRIGFRGTLNDKLRGFYRSTFTDDDGTSHTIATTQFQSTDARRAFPCWDEPAFKATFSSTLVVDADLLAISNTAVVEESDLDDGRRRITFAPTMPMSTYLVAFVVGPLDTTEAIDVGGVPVRVVHRPGQGHLAPFALDVAAHALRWFTEYYEIPYPSDKVDLVAIPDFAFGAMENLGCVTFREVLLLVDPDGATQPELELVAAVVSHELAHMWFGDLVTMSWWEGIWLNEAFATFMETACVDAYRPDWDVWTGFCRGRSAAFETDALATTRPIEYPVITPADAEGMFDIITYEKGGSVVRMLEQYLGETSFRDGVRHYLRAHAYGTTETCDLWDAIEEATGEPVRRIMDGWILQGGHPVIEVRQTGGGTTITQSHFTLDPDAADDRTWSVPLRLRSPSGDTRVLLEEPSAVVDRIVTFTANADASGFYRVKPDMTMTGRMAVDGPTVLSPAERHGFVDDAWALTISGRLDAADFLRLTAAFGNEDDLTVWQALSVGLAGLTRLTTDAATPVLKRQIAAMARPAADLLGTDPRPDESDRTRERRATLLRLLGAVADDEETIATARTLFGCTDPALAAAALTVVAHHGTADDHARIRSAWQGATDPQTEQRHLRALAGLPDPALVKATLAETLDGTIRTQDGPHIVQRALENRHAGEVAWAFVTEHWEQINSAFPYNSIARMLEGIVALDRRHQADAVVAFLDTHPVPQGALHVAQLLEKQRINVVLREREVDRFSTHLVR